MFDSGKDVKGVVHYQGLYNILKIIRTELFSKYHDEGTLVLRQYENSLRMSFFRYFSSRIYSGHFGIEIIREFVAKKYYTLAVVTININLLQKRFERGYLCLPIVKTPVMIRSLLSLTGLHKS